MFSYYASRATAKKQQHSVRVHQLIWRTFTLLRYFIVLDECEATTFKLIDVREPHEYLIASIPTAKLIPLGDVAKRANELDQSRLIVAHCKMGGRSAKAVAQLKELGFRCAT